MRRTTTLVVCAVLLAAGCLSVRQVEQSAFSPSATATSYVPGSHSTASPQAAPRALPVTDDNWTARLLARCTASSLVQISATFKTQTSPDVQPTHVRETSLKSNGTGIVVGAAGVILTTHHVLRDVDDITVTLSDGSRRRPKRVVVDEFLDLAVLVVDADMLQPLPLRPAGRSAAAGTPVLAITGHDSGDMPPFQQGVVTHPVISLQNEIDPTLGKDYSRLIETTVRLLPGYSGGPLLDTDGRLVGLNVAVAGSTDSDLCRGYAIPFDDRTRQAVTMLIAQATK